METPELFQANYCNAQFAAEKSLSDARHSDQFIIEDLLDFPSDENTAAPDGGFEAAVTGTSTDSSAVTAVDNSCHSSFSNLQAAGVGAPGEGTFAGELCVPYDDMAELEWLSNFVDESFSSVDLPKLHLIHGIKARPEESPEAHHHHFQPEPTRSGPTLPSEVSIPAKARSKRSRAAPGSWTSRLLAVAPPPAAASPAMSSSSSSSPSRKKLAAHKKKEWPENTAAAAAAAGEVRKCLHCATDKTPQWRTGPMGPKTLCNACGVRYKSGRLVPEYRPAASPTFVMSKHSNSHRKVMELRRQKDMMLAQQPLVHQHHNHPTMMFDVSNGEDYLIPQHIGPDFGPVI